MVLIIFNLQLFGPVTFNLQSF